MINLENKTVLVTGASSMIGRCVVSSLLSRKAVVVSASHSYCDLMDIYNLHYAFDNTEIDYAIHLGAYSGNVNFNRTFPADTFYRTAQMGLNVLKYCQGRKVKKVVSVLSSCAYPDAGYLLSEDSLWDGLPNESIESHGLAKRMLDAYSRQLYKQYKLNAVSVIVNNSYGPHDSFLISKTKVVGGLIKRFTEAKQNNYDEVICWGTGKPKRNFVFSEDAGEGIVKSLELHEDSMLPLNIDSTQEISIKNLAELIRDLVGYKGVISWSMGEDGQLRKGLSIERMVEILNWIPATPLEDGLRKTIDWYNNNG